MQLRLILGPWRARFGPRFCAGSGLGLCLPNPRGRFEALWHLAPWGDAVALGLLQALSHVELSLSQAFCSSIRNP